jgi:hypothetical protein
MVVTEPLAEDVNNSIEQVLAAVGFPVRDAPDSIRALLR